MSHRRQPQLLASPSELGGGVVINATAAGDGLTYGTLSVSAALAP